ncbi:uncharacterized protein LOC112560318 isoform X2 [Pomacea canaliculata]|uniref:uncharacterized protein LOC112560318 isoform X2 n=1 Tax=Pomacea canaliculata TaxID=400727 RepID=UPI000D72679F|nr:uncharacterized protein LOC112560318 isoform X2 [Pomacea canaliculata]
MLQLLTSLLFAVSLFQQQSVEAQRKYCDIKNRPVFENAEAAKWNSFNGDISCQKNFVYLGQRPAAQCVDGKWLQNGKCWRYLWLSPAKGTIFSLVLKLKAGSKFTFGAILTPKTNTSFTVRLSDPSNHTAIVIRVIFKTRINGTDISKHIFVHTVKDGQIMAETKFWRLFPFVVGTKTHIKLIAESVKTLGLVVGSTKIFRYVSATTLRKLTNITISEEADVNFANALCRICNISDAPEFPLGQVAWNEKIWPVEGNVTCNKGNITWKGNTPPKAFCLADTWFMNGGCLPRFMDTLEKNVRTTVVEPLPSGDKITMTVLIRDNNSFVDLIGKDKVYRFIISVERQAIFADPSGKGNVSPSTLVPNPNIKLNSTLFLQFHLVNNYTIEVTVNGRNSSVQFHSATPMESIVGVNSNQEILFKSKDNDLQGSNVCREDLAPSFDGGVIKWKKVDKGLEGEIRCHTDYDCFPVDGCSAKCDDKTGWRIDAVCKRYAWTSGPYAANKVFLLPESIKAEREICLSGNTVGVKRHNISFRSGTNNLIHFQFDLENKTVHANTYIHGIWKEKVNFKNLCTAMQAGNVFMKFRFYRDINIELEINGFHRYIYSSGYNFRDMTHLSTSMVILALDLVCDRHKTNFCREELAPSLDNGALTWRKTQDRLEGSAVCNNKFALIKKSNSTSHCDSNAGWVMSEQCVSLITVGDKEPITKPKPLTSGKTISMVVVIRDKDSFVDLKGDNTIYRFVIRGEGEGNVPDTSGKDSRVPTTVVPIPNMKLNSTVFLQFHLVNSNIIQVTVNGGTSSAQFHSATPLESIVGVNSNQEVLFKSENNDLQGSNVCTEDFAPSFDGGVIKWKKVDKGLEGEIRCHTDYDCPGVHGCSAKCDDKTGWRIDPVCKRYAWTSGPYAANTVFHLPEPLRAEQELYLTASTVGDRRPVISLRDGVNNRIQFRFDLDEGTVLASTYVYGIWQQQKDFKTLWTVKRNARAFMKLKIHSDKDIELVINGFYRYMYPSGYNFKDLMHLSTSLVVMAIDVVGDRHRTNFCREELAPSLDNGALTWRKTQDRLEGSAVCNNDFLLINKGKSTSHCDRKAGWVMSEQCVSRHPVERPMEDYACEANHIPKVLNGKVLQAQRNGSVLIADVICNGNFVRSTSKSSSVVCSSLTGWLFDDVCNEGVLIRENKILDDEKKEKITRPKPLTSGKMISMVVFIRDKDSFVDLKGENTIYRFVIRGEGEGNVPDTSGKDSKAPTTVVPIPNMKLNSTVFLQFHLVNSNIIQVTVNGGTSSAQFHSATPLESIVGVNSNQEILFKSENNDLQGSNVCREDFAPSFDGGVIKWKKVDKGLEGEIKCHTDYDCPGVHGCSAKCDDKTGWRIDPVCKRYAWTSGPYAANAVFLLPEPLRAEQELYLTASTEGDRRPVISLRDGVNNRIQFRFDLDEGTVLASTYVTGIWRQQKKFKTLWTVKRNARAFMKLKIHSDKDIELVINGFYRYMYPSGYNFKDLMHLSTSLVVMAIDVVGDRHRTNFCREELAPSLDNGALTWRKTQDRLEGSAVCNNDFL